MSLIKRRLEKLQENSPFNWTGRVHLGRKWAVFRRTGREVCVTWCAVHYRSLIRWPFLLNGSFGKPAIIKGKSALIDGEFLFFCLLCSFLFMSVAVLMLFVGLVVLPHPHFLITSLPFELKRRKCQFKSLFSPLTNKVMIQSCAASLSKDDELLLGCLKAVINASAVSVLLTVSFALLCLLCAGMCRRTN